LKRARRLVPTASIAALAVLATSAHASAPGWSTPHTVKAYTVGTFAAGPNAQAVQLFGTGGAPTRTAQLRAIKPDATQGTAVGVNAGAPGFDFHEVSVNANGRLVAAWTLDTQAPQVAQRSADKRCKAPSLFLSISGDGLGLWQCSTSSSGTSFAPRLARLTNSS
jgi:hypothetical protein